MTEEMPLHDAWDFYYRMPKCTDWSINGYFSIQNKLQTAEQCTYIMSALENETIKGGMFYIMRHGIQPIWECAENIQGGFFSFRIQDAETWRNAIYAMLGNTLFTDEQQMKCVNGISVTPKSGFMTLKLWLSGGNILSLSNMIPIPGLDASSATFRYNNIQTALPSTRPRPVGNKRDEDGKYTYTHTHTHRNHTTNHTNHGRPTPRQTQTPQKANGGIAHKRWGT